MTSTAHAAGSGTSGDPFTTLTDAYTVSSGRYYFNTGSGLFQADVDNSEGGGWVLVLQYVHQGGTDPSLSILGAGSDLPVTSFAALGADESGISANWGHAGNAGMAQFTGDIQTRFYGISGNHSRIIHFWTTLGDDYLRTGNGSFAGSATDFTALTGHSALLPASDATSMSNQGDLALTRFPFRDSASNSWAIKGGADWEVDDNPDDESQNTIHRVWVRSVDTGTVVINTNDSGTGSLRAAIDFANANTADDDITFAIPGTGPHTISLTSPLDNITDNGVSIDGTTQSGASCGQLTTGTQHNLMIHLDGTGAGTTSAEGIVSNADNVTIRGLSITGFQRQGVAHLINNTDFLLDCSYIGVEPDGTTKGTNGMVNGVNNAVQMGGNTTGIIRNSLISGNDDDTIDDGVAYLSGSSGTLEGNIIGLNAAGTAALGNGRVGLLVDSASNVTIGGTTPETRNIISGNASIGIYVSDSSAITILGNYIGLNQTGTASVSNGNHGIYASNTTNLTIGNGLASGRNVIVEPDGRPIRINNGGSAISINGNYIGTDVTGNTSLQTGTGGSEDGIVIAQESYNGIDIINNVIGGFGGDAIELSLADTTITDITIQGNNIGIGADGITSLPTSPDVDGAITARTGLDISGLIIGGTGAGEGNMIANSGSSGIFIKNAVGTVSGIVTGNTIRDNTSDGITQQDDSSTLAIYSNNIYSNGGLGIDLGTTGVTDNDSGDGDTGPNELLNFPLINAISAGGTTSVDYSVTLDVPANTKGYRIEFFKNTSPDTTNGEGEIFLGFVDTGDHAGGAIDFDGTFTASENVSSGDSISATATRKTGALAYDITSEFSANKTAQSALVVTNTNDSGVGSLRAAIDFANANTAEDDITFAISGAGPHLISPLSALPTIADDDVSIDGSTQSGASCGQLTTGTPHTLLIRIDGLSAGSTTMGLRVNGANTSFRGLSVTGFQSRGISVETGADNNTIECSYIGVQTDGETKNQNVRATNTPAINIGDVTGGTIRNSLISGNDDDSSDIGIVLNNATNFTIEGNIIGLNASGTTALGNGSHGLILLGTNNNITIGGTTAETRNIISGNVNSGIYSNSAGANISIIGNYIGVNRAGNAALPNGYDGITFENGSVSGVTIGGTTAAERNIISGNDAQAIDMRAASNISILGNYIGTDVTGLNGLGNGTAGGTPTLYFLDVADVNIGNGTAAGRNIISGGTGRAIETSGTVTNLAINDNYIGTDITGNTALKNGTEASATTADVVLINNVNNLDILNNVFGPYDSEGIEFWGGSVSDDIVIQGNSFGIGADGTTPFTSGRASHGHILFGNGYAATNVVIGGTGAGEGNILANSLNAGISINTSSGFTGEIIGNEIYNNAADGIAIRDIATVAVYQNTIYNNGGLGIDLSTSGVSDNDSGDTDTGPNDLLNFPLINAISAGGTTSVGYSVTLDVPANTEGYRIEFYKNSTPDTTNGEGEVFLGFVDTGDHVGGSIDFDGTFTASENVASGDSISATATRKTGALAYDITSEFSVNKTAASALVVTNSNDSGAGSLRAAIDFANANTAEDDITFAISGTGPHTITLATQLPSLSDAGISIDGTTQSGASCGDLWAGTPPVLQIQITDGTSVTRGFEVTGADISVRGLSLTSFNIGIDSLATATNAVYQCNFTGLAPDGTTGANSTGIMLRGTGAIVGGLSAGEGNVLSGNNWGTLTTGGTVNATIQGNFIGTDPTGLIARPNTTGGIGNGTGTATINEVRNNLISGNPNGIAFQSDDTWTGVGGADLTIAGNYIGTDITGNTALPNTGDGINFTQGSVSDLVIGGTNAADRNVISGNDSAGINLSDQSDISILGNYIGLASDGATALPNGEHGVSATTSYSLTIGGTFSGAGNVISGNTLQGILLDGSYDVSILGNYIGTDAAGTTDVGNGERGIQMSGTGQNNIAIGNGTTSGRNLISGNNHRAIEGKGTLSNIDILGNYIGTNVTGNVMMASGTATIVAGDGISFDGGGNTTGLNIIDNVIGAYDGAKLELWNSTITGLVVQGNNIGVGADGTTDITTGIALEPSVQFGGNGTFSNVTFGGTGAGEGNIIANGANNGISFDSDGTNATIIGNTITNKAGIGIYVSDDATQVSILQNKIYNNGSLGIDIAPVGITNNDTNDTDTGPNDLLNYPLINAISASGSTSVDYSVTLDVPANTEGYRIEFFKNTSPDSTNGEGEFFLGFVDTGDHAGGAIDFDGTFTASENVSSGDSISATATRKTGALSYDITSEFSANKTAQSALVVTNTNDSGAGSLRAAVTFANANSAEDNITFDIDGVGPHKIELLSILPLISDANVTIDGTTQSGASCGDLWGGTPHTLMIETNFSAYSGDGLRFTGDDGAIKGLSITGASTSGLYTQADRFTLTCSYVGLEPDGTENGNTYGIAPRGADHVIGGSNAGEGNVISGNDDFGIVLRAPLSNLTIEGNFIGTDPTGLSGIGNAGSGIATDDNSTSPTLNTIRKNLISGNAAHGINFTSGNTVSGSSGDLLIAGNYIGVDRTGNTALPNGGDGLNFGSGSISGVTIGGTTAADRNMISGNVESGMEIVGNSDVIILGNYIGIGADGSTDIGNTTNGIYASSSTNVLIGDGTSGGRNVISSNTSYGVYLDGTTSTTINGNYIGVASDGTTARGNRVTNFTIEGTTVATIQNNIIANSVINDGIELQSGTPSVAIISNSIYNNFGQGINIDAASGNSGEGVNANDVGDGDTGPNDWLNYPLINAISASGSTSVDYSVTLDVPANTEGYRIEFFKNTSPDTTNGEGEIFLGFVDTGDHAGGAISYDGSFTSAVTVSVGDSISATTTRKTGATAYDITSEFAANVLAASPLVVTNTNDSGAGSLRAAITYANANAAEDNITFAIPGSGLQTITLASALPSLTDDGIFIDGTTQSGAMCGQLTTGVPHTLNIEVNGGGGDFIIFSVSADNSSIKGLAVGNSQNRGLFVSGTDQVTIECSYWGLRADGLTASPLITGGNRAANLIQGSTNFQAINNAFSGNNGSSSDVGLSLTSSVDGATATGNLFGLGADGATIVANTGMGLSIAGSNFTIGGTTPETRNVMSGNGNNGVYLVGANNVDILGNYIGLGVDGTTDIGNGVDGIQVDDSSNINIGDGTAAGRNVVSGNGQSGFDMNGSSNVAVNDNYFGTNAAGTAAVANDRWGIVLAAPSGSTAMSNITITNNVLSGNTIGGLDITANSGTVLGQNVSATVTNNKIGVAADGTSLLGNGSHGIKNTSVPSSVVIGGNSASEYNIIAYNGLNGITMSGNDGATLAILGNRIFSNTNLGIDIDEDGVTANDNSSARPNESLNFPLINDFASDGNTGITYDINLDVPAADYRIDFYKNSAPHSTGYGEGEIHLGFVEFSHAGGNLQHTGAFTSNAAVIQGNYISATTTRKTGASTYDITSEFSLTTTTGTPTELTAVKSVTVYDPTSAGLYSLPGNDVISSLTVTNPGTSPADADSIVIIDAIPAEVTFYNGDIDDGGAETNAVSFVQTGGANLTFTYVNDVKYSNSVSRPNDMSGCTYSPSAGYDINVTFLCLNPKGAMASGDPDPTFTVAYRAKIK